MRNLTKHIAIFAILLLAAGPWLQAAQPGQSAAEEAYCACCEGPCHGCCCLEKKTQPADTNDEESCPCKVSDSPALPPTPNDMHDYKVEHKSDKAVQNDQATLSVDVVLDYQTGSTDKSPPLIEAPPAYILNAAFLI